MDKTDERKGLPSASEAERWMLCPGSFLPSLELEKQTSEAAEEGTLLHKAMELYCASSFAIQTTPEFMFEDFCNDKLNRDQMECVVLSSSICDTILETLNFEIMASTQEHRIWIRDVSLSQLCSAKPDVVLANNADQAILIDWKFGRGLVEEAFVNLQLRVQAVALKDQLPQLNEIYVAIIQPRAEGLKKYSLAKYSEDDLAFARTEIVHAVNRALDPHAPRIAGAKQCKYCPLKKDCPEAQTFALVEEERNLIEPARIGFLLDRCEQAESVIETIREKARSLMYEKPNIVPGWQLCRSKISLPAVEKEISRRLPRGTKAAEKKEKIEQLLEGAVETKTISTTRRKVTNEGLLVDRLEEHYQIGKADLLKIMGKFTKVY